ncbi:heavy metal translocating P-type ATPase [Limnochorda pilosa]|uniref:Heavy metal translocating P-type ATPase n=1 Tax=Limnochorda pilosa TaxID=1555112 RepID=A0A0K2SL41_LIMPI|nr:heavy metal translocating P-type ATPase [Limnochorda pilosa]BAS27564.1 heavy metal translocating P-type ATPase [Limnochorda pilosa]
MIPDSVREERLQGEWSPTSRPIRASHRVLALWRRYRLFAEPGLTLLLALAAWGIPAEWTGARVALYAAAYLAGGLRSTWQAVDALRQRVIDVDLLMVLAALGAAAIGQQAEGASLLFLFSLSNALQEHAVDRTRRAVESLMRLRPEKASVVDERGTEREVPVEHVLPGQWVVVRPGEQVPVDGEVVEGRSSVDQSTITGESIPVEKGPGDEVFASTLNQMGTLRVRVTRRASETALARIVRLVARAQAQKAQTQRRMERLEQRYAWAVLGVTAVAAGLPLALGVPFHEAFYRAMVLMVVASPCAVVMASPPAFLSAIARGARLGFLFKGGVSVERASDVEIVAFDKTGTLTTGKPRVTDVVPTGPVDRRELLGLAAAVERSSEHPLAEPLVRAARDQGLEPTAQEVEALPGLGVRGRVGDLWVWVGSPRLFERLGAPLQGRPLEELSGLEGQGKTVMAVGRAPDMAASSVDILGLLAVVDEVRPEAAEAVRRLREAGVRQVVMLTGDNRRVAEAIGAQVGVDEVRAELLPEQKQQVIAALKDRGRTAMVGDGVNDAPALASADLGIAMGAAGTDVALESADLVLMGDRLLHLPEALRLSRFTLARVRQNLFIAFGVIGGLVLLTLSAGLPLALGVLGHEGSTVLVALNGLRLLAWRSPA